MENVEEGSQSRTSQEVAERVLGIIASIGKVHFPEENQKWITENNIEQYLTPLELAFINDPNPDQQDLVDFSWRAEALVSLVWSLQGIEEPPRLNELFDARNNELVMQAITNTKAFLASATLRNNDDLEQMESFLYHQHWRVRDRDLGFNHDKPDENDPDINELDSGIVYERRYGMSWVVCSGAPWDDVPTDT